MKKLFIITGANGHLGGTIVRMLNGRPVQVRGLVFGDKKKRDTGSIHYYSGDVREPETLRPLFEGCEDMETIVIHTAGIIDISNHVSPELYDVNVNGTKNILALCREYPVKRLVYVSSVHAIPEQKRGNVTGEIRDFSPDAVVGGYAKTKAEATREVRRAAQEGLEIAGAVSGKKKLPVLPLWMAKMAAPFIQLHARRKKRRPLYTAYSLHVLGTGERFSHKKATEELGYHPRDLKVTIRDMVAEMQGA